MKSCHYVNGYSRLNIDTIYFFKNSVLINDLSVPFHHLVAIIGFPQDDMIYIDY